MQIFSLKNEGRWQTSYAERGHNCISGNEYSDLWFVMLSASYVGDVILYVILMTSRTLIKLVSSVVILPQGCYRTIFFCIKY